MANYIPRIEYLNYSTTANRSSGSPTLSSIADTSDIQVGMTIEATGVTTGTTVLSKTSSTVTMSANATSSGTAGAVEFYHLVSFTYPPKADSTEEFNPVERISTSIDGTTQVSIDHTLVSRRVQWSFLTQAQIDTLKTMFLNHARYGLEFRYYESKDVDTYATYSLQKLEMKPKRLHYVGGAGFRWLLDWTMRRVEA